MKKILPDSAILVPDNAKLVFKGQIFDVYQWPQEMFDGSAKTFELLRRPDTVQVIVVRDSRLAMVRDEQPGRTPRLHFAGGRTEESDESWLSTAQRELLEETGLTCVSWKLLSADQVIPKAEWFAPFYLATDVVKEELQQLDADGEKITVIWEDYDNIRKRVLAGDEPTLNYAIPLFMRAPTIDVLLALPEFQGKEVDR